MKTEKRYNVEIYNYATGETVAIIGEGMTYEKADRRETTGLMRCNSEHGCRIVECNS